MNVLTRGFTIEVGNKSYHSLDDWGLMMTQAVSISDPEQQTSYIEIIGANQMLDVSTALTGRPTFKKRAIKIGVAKLYQAEYWDAEISRIRNAIEGKLVKVIFDNDTEYYWQGRAHVETFTRSDKWGKFFINIPMADPFKYDVQSNIDPWLWDSFDFENDSVPAEPVIEVDGTVSIVAPSGTMYCVPTFTVSEMSSPITVSNGSRTYPMVNGTNIFPALLINGDEEVTLTFSGKGRVVMEYRGGSL